MNISVTLAKKFTMKNVLFILSFLLVTSIMSAQSKVGTIDIDHILSQMPQFTSVQSELKTYGESLDNQLKEKMAGYQSKLEEYNASVDSFSETQVEEKQSEIFNLEEEITKFRQNGIQLMRIKEDELKRPLYQKIAEAMDVIAKEQQFTQIFNTGQDGNLVYLDPAFDITDAVMEQLGIEVKE